VSYFAAALARGRGGWTAAELDLDGVEDVDEVADLVRDVDPDAEVSLLFVECEDEFLVVMRVDGEDDPRVFASDAAFAEESRIGEVLLDGLEPATGGPVELPEELDEDAEASDDEDDEEETPTLHPVGEADLLSDLGTPAKELLALCAHEGTLPADVMVELATRAGCADVLEELREG
jgi:putative tRNA adenosine deaminase-associated protein